MYHLCQLLINLEDNYCAQIREIVTKMQQKVLNIIC